MGIGALKGDQLAAWGFQCTDIRNETIKILRTYFSHNNMIKEESKFLKVQTVLRFWNLTIEERTVVSKSLAVSTIVFPVLTVTVTSHNIKALETIQTCFLWHKTNLKIKHETIYKNLTEGGLKNVDIWNKFTSLQKKRLYLAIAFMIEKSFIYTCWRRRSKLLSNFNQTFFLMNLI